MTDKLLSGRVAIVTGAGGGIGRSHALALAQAGAAVVVNDLGGNVEGGGRNRNIADAVVEEIKAMGGQAVANYDSVATREGADRMVYSALQTFGHADILVNNAGNLRDHPVLDLSEDDFDSVYQVHLRGTFLCTQTFVRYLQIRSAHRPIAGRVINTTDLAGLVGNPGQANYGAMKAGVAGFTRAVALEIAKLGATCNAIAPMALTRMTRDLPMFRGASENLLGPQHVSPMVVYLASEKASHINGKIIGVHGPRIFEYQTRVTEGVTKDAGIWTPDEIDAAWGEIVR
jgi:NAD(P)-dependent dehydrogenase (short-subunit alcohol dehydrogenase family)